MRLTVVVIPEGITGQSHSTKEGYDHPNPIHKQLLPPAAAADHSAEAVRPLPADGDVVKTLAVRLTDELMDLLAVVSQIEGSSMVDQIREAIEAHLAKKAAEPDFTEKANEVLAEIDREAAARKEAIVGSLFGDKPKPKTTTAPKGRSRRGQSTEPEAHLTLSRPIGYLPARARRQGAAW